MKAWIVSFLYQNLPAVLAVLVVTGLVVAAVFSTHVSKAIRKLKNQSSPPPPSTPAAAEIHHFVEKSSGRYGEKLPMRGGRLAELLAVRGYLRVGEFSLSFLRALHFIRRNLGGWGAQYVFPWYLALGDSQSGKTELFRHSQLNLPVGEPDFEGTGSLARCQWWFFDHSIVLDIKGHFLFAQGRVQADEKHWQLLLLLLNRYRPKRPIDGVILTLSCEDLVGLKELDHDAHLAKAKMLYLKLSEIQDFLGMQVPVYVVVTKCDSIPGFQEFCQQIPPAMRQQVFGWSSPYSPGVAYTPAWMDEAFDSLDQSLHDLSLEMLNAENPEGLRSEAYLFPLRFRNVKDPLALYVNSLFKASGYRDPFIFRGVYFTGQGAVESTASASGIPTLNARPMVAPNQESRLSGPLYFVKDLLQKKVFREFSLARPVQQRLFTSYRNIVLARVAVTLCLCLMSLGAFRAFVDFKKAKADLLPLLYQIDSIVGHKQEDRHERRADDAGESPLLDQQTQILVSFLKHMHSNALFSIFIPSSWLDRLTTDINKSIAAAYERIIARSITHEFNQRFLHILEGKYIPTPQTPEVKKDALASKTDQHAFSPLKDSLFEALQRFTDQLGDFEKFSTLYNRMVETRDHSLLPDLTDYLFGFRLPSESLYYITILSDSPHFRNYPKLDLESYQTSSRHTFRKRLQAFAHRFLTLSDPYEPLLKLSYTLKRFGTDALEANDSDHMATLYRDVSTGVNDALVFMDSPELAWIADDPLNFGAPYAKVINKASEISLVGRDYVSALLRDLNDQFSLFRDALLALSSPATGPFFAREKEKLLATPSEGLLSFGKNLKEFFALSFMAPAEPDEIKQEIPLGQRLMWETTLLTRAVELTRDYKRFHEQKLKKYPSGLQETLTTMARENLGLLVKSLLAKAQAFVDVPHGASESDIEEEIRAQIPHFKETGPMLSQLMGLMAEEGLSSDFVVLRDLLLAQIMGLLGKVNDLLEAEKLYAIKDNNFEWWDGDTDVMLDAFKVKDKEDLKAYLESQRSRITWMAKEFAEPLLSYVKTDHFRAVDMDFDLVTKWSRILTQVEAFAKRKPGNSVSTLENYLFRDINDIDFSNCFDKISPENLQEKSGDYFLDERNVLRKKLYDRCESDGVTRFRTLYAKTSTHFNTKMANKFPFVPVTSVRHPGARPGSEVKAEDVKIFFKLVDQFDDHMDRVLEKSPKFSKQKEEVAEFIKSARVLKVFFGGFAKGESKYPLPTFKVTPEFRINRPRERSASNILDWEIDVGDGQILTMHDPGKTALWSYGSPVRLTFGWADHGSMKPHADDKITDMEIEGGKARFVYTNQWALLWLLYTRLADVTEIAGNETPFVLKFVVPEEPTEAEDLEVMMPNFDDQQSRFFVRLTLAAQATEGAKPITDLSFPVMAPTLPETAADAKDKGAHDKDDDDESPNDDSKDSDDSDDEEPRSAPSKKKTTRRGSSEADISDDDSDRSSASPASSKASAKSKEPDDDSDDEESRSMRSKHSKKRANRDDDTSDF